MTKKDKDLFLLFDVIENYIFTNFNQNNNISFTCLDVLSHLTENYTKEFNSNLFRLNTIITFIQTNLYIYKN